MNDWNKLRNSLKESIAPPTNSQYGSPVISENRIPHASHSILSFFPPNYDSSSCGSASNEMPPRLSHSIMSRFPPTWSQNESSRSDESLPPFSHSITSIFPPNYDSSSRGSASNETPPRLSHSIISLFPPTWSQNESSRPDESLPPFSHSIPSIFPPTKSETESSESNERLITRSSHSIQSIFQSNNSDTTSSDSIHIFSPSPSYEYLYPSELIRSATNNFLAKTYTSTSSTRSWRCTLRGKNAIVFQRKFRRKMGMLQLTQRLSVTCRSHHSSIIKLLGASVSGDVIYLVYDFVYGANLANSHGLAYIHNNMSSLVHNHIKSSSIIVTESSFNAKICHIGTAQLCGEIDESEAHKDSEIQEVSEEADRGYMPPEFQRSGIATQKCDVYAFGVVILELLSGEEPLKYKHDKATGDVVRTSVIETAAAVFEEGDDRFGPEYRLRFWVDRRLNDSFPVDVAEKLIRLALDCVHVEPDKRPNMTSVAWKISKTWSDKLGTTWSDKFGKTWSGKLGRVKFR
uniref:Protein kinase domain-containing protein n=1 Tax=Fagus sylvatica TaxID=28930 RepID=A0A2N9JAJ5_FAGSY